VSAGAPSTVARARGLPPVPVGFRVVLDPSTVELSDGSLLGGEPRRIVRLTPHGRQVFEELMAGPVRSTLAGTLARRLVTAGVAHPVPPHDAVRGSVAVVVPVKDRAFDLDRCLASLTGARVVVVDDGSDDRAAVAAVAARHGANVAVRGRNGGPAAARNTGLAATGADLVAFVDSDCVAPPGWLDGLTAHFADPAVGAVAPRVLPRGAPRSWLAAYAAARSPLDLGPREALVRPGTRVSYVPTAALVVRRTALPGFDEDLRYGEDVDAVWRMIDAGWQVRYDPSVTVSHSEPATWRAFLTRRFHYGTSTGPLARRHPERLAPLVLQPWPTAAAALVVAGRPVAAAATAAVATSRLARRLDEVGAPTDLAPRMTAEAVTSTLRGLGRATTQLALPLAVVVALAGPRPFLRAGGRAALLAARGLATVARGGAERGRAGRDVGRPGLGGSTVGRPALGTSAVGRPALGASAVGRPGLGALAVRRPGLGVSAVARRLAGPVSGSAGTRRPVVAAVRRMAVLAALVAAPALEEWVRRRPRLDPARWVVASVADDVAYGAGVWRGAIRARTAAPLLPRRPPAAD